MDGIIAGAPYVFTLSRILKGNRRIGLMDDQPAWNENNRVRLLIVLIVTSPGIVKILVSIIGAFG